MVTGGLIDLGHGLLEATRDHGRLEPGPRACPRGPGPIVSHVEPSGTGRVPLEHVPPRGHRRGRPLARVAARHDRARLPLARPRVPPRFRRGQLDRGDRRGARIPGPHGRARRRPVVRGPGAKIGRDRRSTRQGREVLDVRREARGRDGRAAQDDAAEGGRGAGPRQLRLRPQASRGDVRPSRAAPAAPTPRLRTDRRPRCCPVARCTSTPRPRRALRLRGSRALPRSRPAHRDRARERPAQSGLPGSSAGEVPGDRRGDPVGAHAQVPAGDRRLRPVRVVSKR